MSDNTVSRGDATIFGRSLGMFTIEGLFTPKDRKNAALTGKMDMQPNLTITVPVRKIKGAKRTLLTLT